MYRDSRESPIVAPGDTRSTTVTSFFNISPLRGGVVQRPARGSPRKKRSGDIEAIGSKPPLHGEPRIGGGCAGDNDLILERFQYPSQGKLARNVREGDRLGKIQRLVLSSRNDAETMPSYLPCLP
jgi:hypothetical protein